MATKTRTDKLLNEVLREVREVRALVEPISKAVRTSTKAGKLPRGLVQALKQARQGKLSGPFSTADEFMAYLRKR